MKSTRIAGTLVAVVALAVPAAASAHPSVYTSDAQLADNPSDPTDLTAQTRYVVANHGFTYVLREDNEEGLDGDHRGVFDYKVLPSAYRATLTDWDDLRNAGATDAQAHATCRVPQLETEAAVRSWQGTDPFYAYVPFQKGSAGLEDDPATWIPKVKDLTGGAVDLAVIDTPAAAEAACEALPGADASSYVPADSTQSSNEAFNSGLIEHTTEPLETEIASLKAAAATTATAMTTLQGLLDAAKAEIAKLTAAAAPMTVTLPTASAKGKTIAKNGATVALTGPGGAPVNVKLAVSERQGRKLKLKSSVLASAKATLGADGRATVTLKPGKAARRALNKLKRSVAMTVTARSGDRISTSGGTLTR